MRYAANPKRQILAIEDMADGFETRKAWVSTASGVVLQVIIRAE